uniref:Uncharacterized protein OSJNBb0035K09.29 n=2 Tax=Oryza sativa subsp. japonica TaxID=39947 RepID=Q69KB9_ORYSJ|nr:hypothetical protein [Oryza sativa Japonica Group]BAD69460.1 hypothetical protein [Oryza sativa Japonica Group]
MGFPPPPLPPTADAGSAAGTPPMPDRRGNTRRCRLPAANAQSVVGDLTAAGPAVGEPANAAPPAADTATVVSATGKATAADARYGEEDEEEVARARERRRTTSGG